MAISAELGETLEQVVADLVENGRYNSKSEVLREGVRLVQERELRLRELQDSVNLAMAQIDAGQGLSADEVFDELEQRYAIDGAH
jgi:antitoxin ParD1/3/4